MPRLPRSVSSHSWRCAASIALSVVLASGCLLDRAGRGDVDGGPPGPDAGERDGGAIDAAIDAAPGPRCGDGVRQGAEACDGGDLGGETCASRGLPEGALACNEDCTFQTIGCRVPSCGDGVKDLEEECDGSDLGTASCATFFLGGTALVCTAACVLDPSGCVGCGNGSLDSTEECDGDAGLAGLCAGARCDRCAIDEACTFAMAGDGRDGDRVVSGTVTMADLGGVTFVVTTIEDATLTLGEPATGLAAGDHVLLYSAQASAAACAPAGRHELAAVASVTGDRVVLSAPVTQRYGAADANADLSGQRIVLQRVPQLDALTIAATGRLEAAAWDGARGGVIALRARRLVLESGGVITASERGYRGGAGWPNNGRRTGRQGESICGHPHADSAAPNLGGGGGGRFDDAGASDGCGQGGGGGGHASLGAQEPFGPNCTAVGAPSANGGGIVGAVELGAPTFGSGGGAGGTDEHSNTSGSGGRGGGLVLLFVADARVDGLVSASGGAGTVPSDPDDAGNGGGGAGGAILLHAGRLAGGGRVEALGGAGAARTSAWNSSGGTGALGRIRVDYYTFAGAPFGTAPATEAVGALASPPPGHSSLVLD